MKSIVRYQRILHTREQQRDLVQKELRTCLESEEEILGLLDTFQKERLSALEQFQDSSGETVSVQELWMSRQAVQVAEGKIERSEDDLCRVREDIETVQHRLQECHKDVRIMETYMGKLQKEYGQLVEKQEQQGLDDFATGAFLRRRHHETQSF